MSRSRDRTGADDIDLPTIGPEATGVNWTHGYNLHDNKVVDLVNYIRSNTIRNEQQFILLMLTYVTGFMRDPHNFLSTVLIGTSSSGKTHVKDKAEELLDGIPVYSGDSGSSKSIIHDSEWNDAVVASMGELQQPPEELIEFMKRVHGGDEQFEYKITTGSVRDGFDADTVIKEAKPYVFTYAQWDPDFELWNRLLKIPAHESESKNRAVGAMAFDESHIQTDGDDFSYDYPFEAGTRMLRSHIIQMYEVSPDFVALPNESDGYDFSTWDIVEPMFAHPRSESNRIYWMVANLIRASALLNYQDRPDDSVTYDGEEREAVRAEPQDIANIISCLDALRATSHEIDRKKRDIVDAIKAKSGGDNTIEGKGPIREYLKESDSAEVKQSELDLILADLEEHFMIEIIEGAGSDNKHLYRVFEWDALGEPRVDDYADLFRDCHNPITGQPFLEWWSDYKSTAGTNAQDMTAKADAEAFSATSASTSGSSDGGGLNQFGGGITEDVELTQTEEYVLEELITNVDGVRIRDMREVPLEAFLGLTDPNNPDVNEAPTTGTLLDPDHECWTQPDKADTWITSLTDAKREIRNAVDSLIDKDIFTFETVHERVNEQPVDATISVRRP